MSTSLKPCNSRVLLLILGHYRVEVMFYSLKHVNIALVLGALLCLGACKKHEPTAIPEPVLTTEQTIHIEQITIPRLDASLAGELWVPSSSKSLPLVILIAGSGPTDMDTNSVAGIHTNMFRMLATSLADQGVATFRYDKRGVGKSTTTAMEADLTIHTFADDLVAIGKHFENDTRFSTRFLAGHSEGGLLALLASPSLKPDGLILLATAGRTLDEILREQLAKQVPHMMPQVETILDSLKQSEPVKDPPQVLAALFRPSVQPFLMSELATDPAELLAEQDALKGDA